VALPFWIVGAHTSSSWTVNLFSMSGACGRAALSWCPANRRGSNQRGIPVKLAIVVACAVLCMSLAMPTAEGTTRETPSPEPAEQGDESEPVDDAPEQAAAPEVAAPEAAAPVDGESTAGGVAEAESQSDEATGGGEEDIAQDEAADAEWDEAEDTDESD